MSFFYEAFLNLRLPELKALESSGILSRTLCRADLPGRQVHGLTGRSERHDGKVEE